MLATTFYTLRKKAKEAFRKLAGTADNCEDDDAAFQPWDADPEP